VEEEEEKERNILFGGRGKMYTQCSNHPPLSRQDSSILGRDKVYQTSLNVDQK
jgi:hypothetical protein